MKRAISFLATLIFAFVVAFGFVVNTASANNIFTCELTQDQPCEQVLDTHDELRVFFNNLSNINIGFDSMSFRQAAIVVVTIDGFEVKPPVNIQPGNNFINLRSTGATSVFFRNDSVVKPSRLRVTLVGTI